MIRTVRLKRFTSDQNDYKTNIYKTQCIQED